MDPLIVVVLDNMCEFRSRIRKLTLDYDAKKMSEEDYHDALTDVLFEMDTFLKFVKPNQG
jgi:hypothetical protein